MQMCYLMPRVSGEGRVHIFIIKPAFLFSGCPHSLQSFSIVSFKEQRRHSNPHLLGHKARDGNYVGGSQSV